MPAVLWPYSLKGPEKCLRIRKPLLSMSLGWFLISRRHFAGIGTYIRKAGSALRPGALED